MNYFTLAYREATEEDRKNSANEASKRARRTVEFGEKSDRDGAGASFAQFFFSAFAGRLFNKLTSVCHASLLLVIMNFVIALSK